jgi:D-threo-aldose 1-dehydrogenase
LNYKEIGNTGIKVPPIVFGTSALGNLYTALDDNTKLNIVKECFNYVENPVFDSAGKYGAGLALEMLGKCLHELGIKPESVTISNKLGWIQTELKTSEPTFEKGVWHELKNDAIQNISYDGIITCFEQGNELLGGYTPQLVSVHDPDEFLALGKDDKEIEKLYEKILDAYTALSDLRSQGKVKAVGIGAKNWKIIQKVSKDIKLDWVMFANSLTIMNHPPELLEFMTNLHTQGIGIINSAVFHAGFLTGGDFYDYVLIKPNSEINKARFKWRDDFFNLCKNHSILPSTACVNFAMTPPGVVSISLNTSNPKRVKDNVESVEANIPSEFYAKMVKMGLISRNYPYLQTGVGNK